MAKQERSVLQEAIDEMRELISDEEFMDFSMSYMRAHPDMFSAVIGDKYTFLENYVYAKGIRRCIREIHEDDRLVA